MITFLWVLGLFLLFILMASIGVIAGRTPIKGSCGGIGGSACSCSPEKRNNCTSKKETT